MSKTKIIVIVFGMFLSTTSQMSKPILFKFYSNQDDQKNFWLPSPNG